MPKCIRSREERFQNSWKIFSDAHEGDLNNYVCHVMDGVKESNGTWYLLMDYDRFDSLEAFIRATPSLFEFMEAYSRMTDALDLLHQHYLHLDLKPDNVMRFHDGSIRFMDTDSFVERDKLLNTDTKIVLSGSAGYTAPEMISYATAASDMMTRYDLCYQGDKADIFSLGSILFRYLFGYELDCTSSVSKLLSEQLEKAVDAAFGEGICPYRSIAMIRALLASMLDPNPDHRPDVAAVKAQLVQILNGIRPKEQHVHSNFHPNSDRIIGRDHLVDALHEELTAQKEAGKNVVFITGIGGSGKSALAREYAWKYRANYDRIVTVSAMSAQDAILMIPVIGWDQDADREARHLTLETEEGRSSWAIIKRNKLNDLCSDEKVLLIVDNYNVSEDDTWGYWGLLHMDVILTSWNRPLGAWHKQKYSIVLDTGKDGALSKDAAKEIFHSYYLTNAEEAQNAAWKERLNQILQEETEQVDELVEELDRHPLSIRTMAMQMSCNPGMEIRPADMLRELTMEGFVAHEDLTFGEDRDGSGLMTTHAYAFLERTFCTLYRKAREKGLLNDEEAEVLRMMTLIAGSIAPERFESWTGMESGWLNNLRIKGWLEYRDREQDIVTKQIGVYSMAQMMAAVLAKEEDLQSDVHNSEKYLESFDRWEPGFIFLEREWKAAECEYLLRQLVITEDGKCAYYLNDFTYELGENNTKKHRSSLCLKYQEKALDIRRKILGEEHFATAVIYSNIGISYEKMGDLKKGLLYQEKALEITRKVRGEDHPDTASCYDNAGCLYRKIGDREKGLQYKEKALDIRRRILGELHSNTATSYNNVGISYFEMGDREKGLQYKEKALNITRRVLGEEHPNTAMGYNNVGISYAEMGDREKGLQYKEKALNIRRRVLGEEHPDTAASYNNVGISYFEMGDREKGLQYKEKALDITRRVLGEEHPNTAMDYNNVGISYAEMGDREKGLQYQEKALNIRRRVLGEEHPDTATSYNNVGFSYEEMGDREKGLQYKEKALDIRRRVLGEDHLDTAASYNNVGFSYEEMGERERGLQYKEKALDIRRRILGEEHPDTAVSYNNVGTAYEEMGDREKGLQYQEKALDIKRRVLGEDHLNTATSYNNVGSSYFKMGDREKGLQYKEKALDIRRRILGEDHPGTADSYNNVGNSYEEVGERERGLQYKEKALDIRRRVLGEDHPDTATSYNDVGYSYFKKGDLKKGLHHLEKALDIRCKVLGEVHLDTATSYNNVGFSYFKMGEQEKGLQHLEKALEIRRKVLGEEHPDTATSYGNVGYSYTNFWNRHEEAAEYFHRAYLISRKHSGEENPTTKEYFTRWKECEKKASESHE